MSLRKWVNVYLSEDYKQADLEAVRDDVDQPVVKRGAARACLRLVTDDDQIMKTLETLARESEGRQVQKLAIDHHHDQAISFVKQVYTDLAADVNEFMQSGANPAKPADDPPAAD
jgi:hypothetical protein